MSQMTFEIPDELIEQIAAYFGGDALPEIMVTALQEFVLWLTAEDRPTSISDLEAKRIYNIYRSILPDLLPTGEDIGQTFNLPMGRARYIVQTLNYRYPAFMKKRRLKMLISALEKGEVSREDHLPIAIIPKECEEHLNSIANELYLEGSIVTLPRRIRLSEGIRIEMGINDRLPLLNRLRDDLAKLTPS